MKEEISALMDGELDPEAAAGVIAQLKEADELRSEWAVYHLISDALGQTEAMPANIAQRVRARLTAEPAVLAPRPPIRHKARVFAVAASVAAVAAIGFMNLQTSDRLAENLAENKSASPTTTTNTTMNTDALQTAPAVVSVSASLPAPAQINDYLLAHRQFSPSTAMHGTVPYLRTVVESRENPAR
ncbi:MAG: sigma-E factor negative regulatory protein [Pseudomonadota bacterium]|nr:sigma-E factor negative regulatory protein [Pseudomonadota bacterium]